MNYEKLSPEDFDAVVTGELTHFALWLESELVGIISDHFVTRMKREDFERLILRRDGLTFQNKVDIVRAMEPLFKGRQAASNLKGILKRIENFKSIRNSFAHGLNATPENLSHAAIHIEVATRSGKEKIVIVTPQTHQKSMDETETLLGELTACRAALKVSR